MEAYSYTKEGIEDLLDTAKVVILRDMVQNELIDVRSAEQYAGKTFLTISKKTFFRTISNLWHKEEETDGFYIIAVHSDSIDVLEAHDATTIDKGGKILRLIKDDSSDKDK